MCPKIVNFVNFIKCCITVYLSHALAIRNSPEHIHLPCHMILNSLADTFREQIFIANSETHQYIFVNSDQAFVTFVTSGNMCLSVLQLRILVRNVISMFCIINI